MKAKPKPIGRPSDFTQETANAICERIANGVSLREICRAEDMPAMSTVFRWLGLHKEFSEQYARARETQADTIFDEILDIADDARNDWMERNDAIVENGEAVRRSQLRIDARKWMAGKMRPKVYGDKITTELSGPNGGPIETKDITPIERAQRTAFALRKAATGPAKTG